MQEHHDYYRILNLSENATLEDIKTAFRRLARDCHPDLHPNDKNAAERFRLLREAYEVLSDSGQRNRYDRRRGVNGSGNQQQTSPQVYYVRGVEKILVRDYRAAIAAFSEAIRLNGRFVEAYQKRCEAYIAIGQERAALEDCQQILRYQPDNAIASYYRGRARQRLGYADSAIKAYTHAIQLDKNFAPANYYRGVANHELRHRNQAIADWREYAELCKQQGNLQGYRLGMNALSQYSWFPLKIGNRVLEQLSRLGTQIFPQKKTQPPSQSSLKLQQSLRNTLKFIQVTIQTSIITLLQIFKNPVGGILSAYGRLEQRMVTLVSCEFILLSEVGFVIGLLSRFPNNDGMILPALALGIIPILSLFLISWITYSFKPSSRHWTGNLFLASSATLPLAAFSGCSLFFSLLPTLMILILAIFMLSHTVLLLYGGCSQLLNLAESSAALVVPIMMIVTTFLTWVGFSVLF